MTSLIETLAGVTPGSELAAALAVRAEVMRLSEAAHDAVLLPRDPGGLSHALRAALAARMARHAGDGALAAHYDEYLARTGDTVVAPLAHPKGTSGDPLHDATARHADRLTLAPREAIRDDVEALKAVGLSEPDVVGRAARAPVGN